MMLVLPFLPFRLKPAISPGTPIEQAIGLTTAAKVVVLSSALFVSQSALL